MGEVNCDIANGSAREIVDGVRDTVQMECKRHCRWNARDITDGVLERLQMECQRDYRWSARGIADGV